MFCVSSRAYQKLSGRMQKDSEVPGFTSKEQTEVCAVVLLSLTHLQKLTLYDASQIPQLQTHCKKLTENGRQANCRRFMNSMIQLLNSLSLWASDDGSGIKLTSQQRDSERGFLNKKLKELEKALQRAVNETLDDVMSALSDQIFDKFQSLVAAAAAAANGTQAGWGAHRDNGGLHFMTYKATTRRQGVYSGASGHRGKHNENPVGDRISANSLASKISTPSWSSQSTKTLEEVGRRHSSDAYHAYFRTSPRLVRTS